MPILDVQDLRTEIAVSNGAVHAVDGVSFSVDRGELLGGDAATTALDVTIQQQILELIDDLRSRLGMAVILVTHDLGVIAGRADRVAVMYAGRIVEVTDTNRLFGNPRHPYTEALFEA